MLLPKVCGICGGVNSVGITELADDLDDGALAALGRDLGRGEEIDALLLVERANDHLELRIGEDAGDGADGRRQRGGARDGKSSASMALALIAEIAAAIAGVVNRVAVLPTGPTPGATNGKSAGLSAGEVPGVPPPRKTFLVAGSIELPEQPVEAQFLEIVLLDFDELGFDLDLHRALVAAGC